MGHSTHAHLVLCSVMTLSLPAWGGGGKVDRPSLQWREPAIEPSRVRPPPVPRAMVLPEAILKDPALKPSLEIYKRDFLDVQLETIEGREEQQSGRFRPVLPSTVRTELSRGVTRKPLQIDEFLDTVGEARLARSFAHRRRVRWATASTGATAMGIGVVLISVARLAIPAPASCRRDSIGNCDELDLLRHGPIAATQWSGTGVAISGLILWITGSAITRRPPRLETLEGMAASYNQRLRKRLGLMQADTPGQTAPAPVTISVAPRVDARGAGVDAVLRW